ncbi:MAG: LysE family transporter, partial [Anaerolineales bacterium]
VMAIVFRNVVLGLSLAAPLGPSGVAVIHGGLRGGFQRAFLTGLGVTLGDATYLLVVFFGVSQFLEITWVKGVIWTIGAIALGYFGFRSIREATGEVDLKASAETPSRHPLLVGYIVNVSNPIAVVWWLGVFGSLLAESASGAPKLSALLLSSTILVGILIWHTITSLLTHWGRRFLEAKYIRIVSLLAGVILLLFSLRFAYQSLLTATGR